MHVKQEEKLPKPGFDDGFPVGLGFPVGFPVGLLELGFDSLTGVRILSMASDMTWKLGSTMKSMKPGTNASTFKFISIRALGKLASIAATVMSITIMSIASRES